MNENNNNNKGRGVFYGVIGVATLVVAIIGATFAYFTAAQNAGNGVIGGNMATIGFQLEVTKVVDPGVGSGMIPMSNSMVQPAVVNSNTCTDDNGNAVCQIYKITVTNTSTAAMFVDGYVALAGGSGIPTDVNPANTTNDTTMRWAQVFATTENETTTYSTAGSVALAADDSAAGTVSISTLDAPNTTDTTGHNISNIVTDNDMTTADVTGTVTISAPNTYAAVNKNYIRISDHAITTPQEGQPTIDLSRDFTRTSDVTSMLIVNQQLGKTGEAGDSRDYYFVVWLSETGHNQTPGASATSPSATTNPEANNFFNGIVRFISAQGSEVTATFSGYTAVASDNAATTGNGD